MKEQEIMVALVAAIAEECGHCPPLTIESTAMDVPGWDSMAHVRIIMNLEDRIARPIDIDQTYRAATIGDLIALAVSA